MDRSTLEEMLWALNTLKEELTDHHSGNARNDYELLRVDALLDVVAQAHADMEELEG